MAKERSRSTTGGRPAQITLADIEREGRRMGLTALTVGGVASALGVTPTALYRHVDGKLGLERLVGESVLAEFVLVDDPGQDAPRYLLSLAHQLRAFALAEPGITAYLQTFFPRGESGARLQREAIESLGRRGYDPAVGAMLSGTVAQLAISLTAAEQRHLPADDNGPLSRELENAEEVLESDAVLATAHGGLPNITEEDYFRMVMTACIRGLTDTATPGRPALEVLIDLGLYDQG
ncbi:hypothetical protein FB561_0771 [Kribbella amoyensis]|uniref:TetR family transcriptional regulator n=1 Tax=Kribbella amoyensis TaxID=996641 RepID=A0A561BLJ2_9ACTN|nr:hypothetical protein [Kribbella amoyensis]TWD79707.1 hypothetical protein FB561_0771 [Kribbella amoyensis]